MTENDKNALIGLVLAFVVAFAVVLTVRWFLQPMPGLLEGEAVP
jgi:hypothetical protein